jgi:hypothetical protein
LSSVRTREDQIIGRSSATDPVVLRSRSGGMTLKTATPVPGCGAADGLVESDGGDEAEEFASAIDAGNVAQRRCTEVGRAGDVDFSAGPNDGGDGLR